MTSGQLTYAVLEPVDGFPGNAPAVFRVVPDREAQERPVPGVGDGTLGRVDPKLEMTFDEAGYAGHDPPASLFGSYVDVAVICVTNEAVAASLKFLIQFVQYQVRQDGRKRTALWRPLSTLLEEPGVKHACRQECPNKSEHSSVGNTFRDFGHQLVMVDPVEEFFQVNIDAPVVTLADVGLRPGHGLMGRASGTEAIAVLAERRIPQRLKLLEDRLLEQAVKGGGNAEVAPAACRFGYPDPSDRPGMVAPLQQLFLDFGPVCR